MADDPMCPACSHAKRRHDKGGCCAAGGECICPLTAADFAPPAPAPEPAPTVTTDEHANPAPVTAHHLVTGWGGVPGECGAECACGLTYDHFDTIAEAAELLDDHIAAANSASGGDNESDVDALDGIGSEYIKDPVERIEAFAVIAPEYVRLVDQTEPVEADDPEPATPPVVEPPVPAAPRRRPAPSTRRRPHVPRTSRTIDVAVPMPSPAPAAPPENPFTQALDWWDSWRCGRCFSRYFTPRRCCGAEAEPVRVFVMPREVPGA